MFAQHFAAIRFVHIVSAALSGTLFCARGILRLCDLPLVNYRPVRYLTYVVDCVLLATALLLVVIIRQYPFRDGWLTMKLALLVLYIILGSMALRHAKTREGRVFAYLGALAIFGMIVGVAVTHHPAGWLIYLRR